MKLSEIQLGVTRTYWKMFATCLCSHFLHSYHTHSSQADIRLSLIHITTMFAQVVLMLREISFSSMLIRQ